MNTQFFRITTAIIATLNAAPAVSPNIFRARVRDVPDSFDTAVNVQFNQAEPRAGAISGAPVDWMSNFSVECFAKSKDLTGDEAIDALMRDVYARICADTTLGGLVDNVGEPRIEAEYSAESVRTGWVRMTFPVEHRTQNLTLE
jgi:hypothetical protein